MELDIFVVDAFTELHFKGNSAAVIPVKNWPKSTLMQNIAAENNLSETAFIKNVSANKYQIRWFSPLTEIDFCGHATLAASLVLFNYLNCSDEIQFITEKVGTLTVIKLDNDRIEMSFPKQQPEIIEEVPSALIRGLSIKPIEVLRNRQAYFAVFACVDDIRQVSYQAELLKTLAPYDVVVTAAGSDYDFISRYFWPANGGDEDPVTGSIHAGLAPYWSSKLGKSELVAYQASNRGGVLYCNLASDRVLVSGNAVLYLRGKIYL